MRDAPRRINDLEAYFEAKFEKPDPWHLTTSDFEMRKYYRQISAIKEFVDPRMILELGSAEGAFTELLLNEFPHAVVQSVEISRSATKRARLRLGNYGSRVSPLHADIVDFLSRDTRRRWDCIVWSESLEYFARSRTLFELIALLRQCLDHLSRDGCLCSANTFKGLNEKGSSEAITCMAAVRHLLSELGTCRLWCHYRDYKTEAESCLEYELWIFQAPQVKELCQTTV